MATHVWTGATNTSYNNAGNWTGGIPAAGGDVTFSGSVNCVMDVATAALNSWDMTGYTGILSSTGNIRIDNSADAVCLFAGGTHTWSGQLLLNPASTRTLSLTSAGKLGACAALTVNGAGTVSLQDALTIAATATLKTSAGTFLTNNYNVDCQYFDATTGTVTLTLGSSVITCRKTSGYAANLNNAALTVTTGTFEFLFPGASAYIAFSKSVNKVSFTGGGNCLLVAYTTGLNFLNVDFSSITNQTSAITLYGHIGNSTSATDVTLKGNSAVNRLLVQSSSVGTRRNIECRGTLTCEYVDFIDIGGTGTADWDLSLITGGSGDCGGNTGITFTTAVDQTWSGATGNWSNSALWTSRIPLPQDNVVIPDPGAASRTLTADVPRLGKDITVTNTSAANKPTLALTNQANTIYGSLTLVSSTAPNDYMVFSCNKALTFAGRSNATLTNAGNTLGVALTIAKPTATLTAQDATSCTTTTISASTTLDLGAYTWTLTGSGAIWANSGTVTGGTSSIIATYNGATATTFAGGTSTYNDIVITPGTGILTFSGAFTFNNMKRSAAGTKTINFTKNTNYTMTGDDFFNPGASTDLFTITSTGNGSGSGDAIAERFSITNNTEQITTDYLALSECVGLGSEVPFYAGSHSTDGGYNNANWLFEDPSSGLSIPILMNYYRQLAAA